MSGAPRPVGLFGLSALLALSLLGCATEPTPREQFAASVVPVLERSCAATTCHGVAPDAEARGETLDWRQLLFRVDASGALAEVDEAYLSAKRAIDTGEEPAYSSLLRKPLGVESGGLGHFGGASFRSEDDPSYRALYDWIAREDGGGETPLPLAENERLFADTVQPVLVEGTCMTSRCHGATAGGTPYRLDAGYRGRFPIAATRHNYEETLRVASLDGTPGESRVLRKSLPLGAGILHKGMNFDFFARNPGGGAEALRAWVCAERRARTGDDCRPEGAPPIEAFVFVRGPVAPHHAFDLEAFEPGTELILARVADTSLVPTRLENLTAALHPDGPADIREPAVSRDGRTVAFAMRTSVASGHHLWTLDLETREARQLTFGNGPLPTGGLSTDRDPTWGPEGSLWFVSTRAGVVADQGGLLDADVYSLDPATGATRRWTFTPHVERRPVFFDIGAEAGGEVGFSALRDALPAQARAHVFRFPPSQRTEYHQHFGVTPVQTFFYDMKELPDGRYVTVVGDLPAPWEAGALAIVERNFGPEVNPRSLSQEPALERYEPPMVLLEGAGAYRDPAPLPDGRILVAHDPERITPGDAAGAFVPRLELLELQERRDGSGPVVSASAVLVAEPGIALTEPEPVSLRAPVASDAPALAPSDATTALFRHQGLPMLDGLLANLSPSGSKRPLESAAYVRLVEHLPRTRAERTPLPATDPLNPTGSATSDALGPHGPARVLGELPLAEDGSFQAEVPVGVPFRVQALDGDRMALGTGHNRWYYLLPGQTLTQGLSVANGTRRYGSRCAACHGTADGRGGVAPELEPPDMITTASLSLSRFEGQNPRLPLAPPRLGEATRLELDFRDDVQPILERRCVSCHGDESPAAGLALTATRTAHFTVAYEALLRSGTGSTGGRAYVDDSEGRARGSFLIELLTGRELDAPRALGATGVVHPPPPQPPLTAEELLTLTRWIELGATFIGHGEAP